jgi:DNA replication protein DnaC
MLEASPVTGLSIERQEKILALIRGNPLGSYVFSGAPGVGKTSMLKELERCSRLALYKNHAIYSATMTEFQRAMTAKARGETANAVSANSLRNAAGWQGRYSLFLDDFDKVSGSEFIRLQLFEVINAATETPTQLALTTNMRKEEFARFFGDHIGWRIVGHCTWIEMARKANPVPATVAA